MRRQWHLPWWEMMIGAMESLLVFVCFIHNAPCVGVSTVALLDLQMTV